MDRKQHECMAWVKLFGGQQSPMRSFRFQFDRPRWNHGSLSSEAINSEAPNLSESTSMDSMGLADIYIAKLYEKNEVGRFAKKAAQFWECYERLINFSWKRAAWKINKSEHYLSWSPWMTNQEVCKNRKRFLNDCICHKFCVMTPDYIETCGWRN